jgi:GNAT superfamily N-acetyltransferase
MIEIQAVTRDDGSIVDTALLAAAEPVHRQLRPQLPDDYTSTMQAIFSQGGRMTVALKDGRVAGVAVWRLLLKTVCGLELYVDDLVTDEVHRSSGIGAALLRALEAEARRSGCSMLALDSGTQRHRAHRFYFREDLAATSFHFVKPLATT